MSTALLVLDCQRFFESMLPIFNTKNPQKKPALTNIHRLIEHCRAQGYPIILTQHGHLQEAFESTASETPPNTNQLIRKWGTSGLAVRYSKDWEFVPSIDEVVKEMKQQASSGVEGEEVKDGDNPAANIWRKNDDGSTLVVVQKETYDAFLGSSLLKVFEDPEMQKVQRIIVGGVMTDGR